MSLIVTQFDTQTVIVYDDDTLAMVTSKLLIRAFQAILLKQDYVVFLPSSGRTPLKTYQYLAKHHKHTIDWSRMKVVQMDEYNSGQLKPEDYFETFLKTHLITPLGIGEFLSMHNPAGGLYAPDDYESKITAWGGIDFALHGIGSNGHIGFNEPGSVVDSTARYVKLAEQTRRDNFPNMQAYDRPKTGMTLGLRDLKRVKHTVLLATGAHKAPAVQNLLNRTPVSQTPACILWDSPDFGVIVDQKAARSVMGLNAPF